jgi:hypothetical protein
MSIRDRLGHARLLFAQGRPDAAVRCLSAGFNHTSRKLLGTPSRKRKVWPRGMATVVIAQRNLSELHGAQRAENPALQFARSKCHGAPSFRRAAGRPSYGWCQIRRTGQRSTVASRLRVHSLRVHHRTHAKESGRDNAPSVNHVSAYESVARNRVRLRLPVPRPRCRPHTCTSFVRDLVGPLGQSLVWKSDQPYSGIQPAWIANPDHRPTAGPLHPSS